jgi:MerR family transcriptional regulator, copper efflux regulator
MRITEAAQRLGTSPRMLRYRDKLGLLPPVRDAAARGRAGARRDLGHARTARDHGQGGTATKHGQGGAAPNHGQAGTAPAEGRGPGGRPRAHRRFADEDLAAVAHALRIEQRYDISPAALAFGLKVLTEPGARAEVAELGRRIGRIAPPPARALDFEQQRAQRLLRLPPGGTPRTRRD